MKKDMYVDITCQIIRATLFNKKLDLSQFTEDKTFLRIMTEQTFQPFLYHIDKNKEWRKSYYQAFLINEKFNSIGANIKKIFDEHNIDHIFLKGFELKKYYPSPWLRQMGDIDILVKPSHHKKAVQLLINYGFEKFEEVEHDIGLKYEGIIIEIHNLLLAKKEEFSSFFQDPFKNAIQVDGKTFSLDINLNYLYLVAHYVKHIKMGSGLRELCDLYLFKKNNTINNEFIKNAFICEDKLDFFNFLNKLISYVFDQIPVSVKEEELINVFLEYSLKSGIHGFGQDSDNVITKFDSSKENKFMYLIKRLFITPKEMFNFYPWTKSIILLPLGYFFRIFYLLFKRHKQLSKIINHNKTDFFKQIGL